VESVSICAALAALVYRSQNALASTHPMIVRINIVWRAESHRLLEFPVSPTGGRGQVCGGNRGRRPAEDYAAR
jgi:hypothetical protein